VCAGSEIQVSQFHGTLPETNEAIAVFWMVPVLFVANSRSIKSSVALEKSGAK
jgi:hypothetical protein